MSAVTKPASPIKGVSTRVIGPLKECQLCKHDDGIDGVVAMYDAMVKGAGGRWAYMCQKCFNEYGVRLGVGFGQRLVYSDEILAELEKK